jgi:hypothetical protein
MTNTKPTMVTGALGAYQWLTTDQHDLDTLLQSCPQTFLGKYIAVTSLDSGPVNLNEQQKSTGWTSHGDIAYSPQVQSVDNLRHRECGGFDEWYVFESPLDLGQVWKGNSVFEAPLNRGQVSVFVNFLGFSLHDHSVQAMQALADLFWKQLEWIHPESYIADGEPFLNFVSRDQHLFAAVRQALGGSVATS